MLGDREADPFFFVMALVQKELVMVLWCCIADKDTVVKLMLLLNMIFCCSIASA